MWKVFEVSFISVLNLRAQTIWVRNTSLQTWFLEGFYLETDSWKILFFMISKRWTKRMQKMAQKISISRENFSNPLLSHQDGKTSEWSVREVMKRRWIIIALGVILRLSEKTTQNFRVTFPSFSSHRIGIVMTHEGRNWDEKIMRRENISKK